MLGRSGAALVSMVAATPFNRLPTRTSGYFDPECIQFLWICGSRLQPPHPTLYISYWQIKALLMPAPSVTPQNRYFPDAERMSTTTLQSLSRSTQHRLAENANHTIVIVGHGDIFTFHICNCNFWQSLLKVEMKNTNNWAAPSLSWTAIDHIYCM